MDKALHDLKRKREELIMGKWSDSVFGNDTARDLLLEYKTAFSQYCPEEAVEKLNGYVQTLFDSRDEEMFHYDTSLAFFMHENGISGTDVIQRAVQQIDSRLMRSSEGEPASHHLIRLKETLLAPLPKQRTIKLDLNRKPIYQVGDIISLKVFPAVDAADFQYIMIQKVGDYISWTSKICPEIKDYWPVFQLTGYLNRKKPGMEDFRVCRKKLYTFYSDGRLQSYKKRDAEVIGSEKVKMPISKCARYLFFSTKADPKIYSVLGSAH